MTRALQYGGVPVPWTVSWTGEDDTFIAFCQHAKMRALCQEADPGAGKPRFSKPHFNRQRECIQQGLCDLCGMTLTGRTKISLSRARPVVHAVNLGDILQVEPMLHKECAQVSVQHCPSLKEQIEKRVFNVRQVFAWQTQFAICNPEFIHEYVSDYVRNEKDRIVGHAKVHLLKWKDRDLNWIMGGKA